MRAVRRRRHHALAERHAMNANVEKAPGNAPEDKENARLKMKRHLPPCFDRGHRAIPRRGELRRARDLPKERNEVWGSTELAPPISLRAIDVPDQCIAH